jgi:hypothetical protein
MGIRVLILFFVMLILHGCNSYKDVTVRRSLMMPKKVDLPRNSKYVESKKKKTYNVTKHRKKNSKKRY